MALFALATVSFILQLEHCSFSQIWYTDDSAGAWLPGLGMWWNSVRSSGPGFAYFPKQLNRI